MSFRTRVVLFSAIAVAVAIAVASVLVYVLVRGELRDRVDSDLRTDAARTFAEPVVRNGRLVLPRGPLGGPTLTAQLVAVEGGEVIPPSDRTIRLPVTEGALAVAAGEREAFFEDAEADGTHVRVYTAPVERGEAIQIARSLEEVDDVLDELALILALVSLGGLGLGAGLGVLVSRAALSPVARLSEAAREVAATLDLSRRIDPQGGSELGELARSFNTMLNALESSLDAQRQLVADASHELRTPLASLRTNIEVLAHSEKMPDDARERLLADVVAQLDELTGLVGDLVDLARDTELDQQAAAPVRLDRVVETAVERARTHTGAVRIDLVASPCTVRGVESALERAVSNLLDNAIKWSPPGGEVEVEVSDAGEVSVADRGPGIEAGDLPHVFDRFYRSATARELPGSGLGLAIVRRVAETHGGTVHAEGRAGGGTLMRLRLPVVSADAVDAPAVVA
jgi:two-component system, OmpR family, sensor histidine kinase MprB